jgi:hypothetical protein
MENMLICPSLSVQALKVGISAKTNATDKKDNNFFMRTNLFIARKAKTVP